SHPGARRSGSGGVRTRRTFAHGPCERSLGSAPSALARALVLGIMYDAIPGDRLQGVSRLPGPRPGTREVGMGGGPIPTVGITPAELDIRAPAGRIAVGGQLIAGRAQPGPDSSTGFQQLESKRRTDDMSTTTHTPSVETMR